MATLEQNEANLLDAEEMNWRLVAFPLLGVLAVVVLGFGYYYYQQAQRDEMEKTARAALVAAKTPEEMIKVAEQYPNADGATVALFSAADASFAKRDFEGAIAAYQRVVSGPASTPELRDSAQIGLGSVYEATNKADDAIKAYAIVGARGMASPFAPYAYFAASRIYEQRGDKENQRRMLTQAASLDPDSAFVKQAQMKLKEMQPPITLAVPAK